MESSILLKTKQQRQRQQRRKQEQTKSQQEKANQEPQSGQEGDGDKEPSGFLAIEEQLERFADLLIDLYLQTEKTETTHEADEQSETHPD